MLRLMQAVTSSLQIAGQLASASGSLATGPQSGPVTLIAISGFVWHPGAVIG